MHSKVVSRYRAGLRLFAAALLLLCAVSAGAKVEVLDGSVGLSSSIVTSIFKDRRGLMWVGTQNGLNSYDGYAFARPYQELSNQPVTHLSYDSVRNLIWVGTYKGLYCIEDDLGLVHFIGGAKDWSNSRVIALECVPGRNAFVTYESGMSARIGSQFGLIPLVSHAGQPAAFIADMEYVPGKERIFFRRNDDGSLYSMDLEGEDVRQIKIDGYCVDIPASHSRDTLLFHTSSSVFYIDSAGRIREIPIFRNRGRMEVAALFDGQVFGAVSGNYYAEDTLLSFDLETGMVTPIGENAGFFLGRVRYYCLFRDEQQILWLGTNRGIFKITRERELFERLLCNERFRVPARTIIKEPGGDIYTGSYYGLYYKSAEGEAWTRYEFNRKIPVRISVLLDDPEYIYCGGGGGASLFFMRFDKRRKVFETDFFSLSDKERIATSYSMLRDRNGIIWIGNNGLLSYDPATGKMIRHRNDLYDIGNCVVQGLKEGRGKDIIWIATDRGLFEMSRKKGILAYYNKESTPALSSSDIYFVEEDSTGKVWLGTNGGGVNVISADRESVQYLNKEQDGLSNDIVYGMLRDGQGRIWMSTFNGLSCYNPQQESFFNYFITDGLCDNEFNYNSFLKAEDGKMYFGGVNGISAFFPDRMEMAENRKVSLFVLPVTKWNEQSRTFSTIRDFRGEGEKIVLNAPSSSLVINLGLTDYTDPIHNDFSYRIQGLFDAWVPLSGRPLLRLNGIPYGDYTVEIRAKNARGLPANNILRFFLQVKLPFYKTMWFYSLLLIVSGLMISVFFIIKNRNLRNMQKLRLRIASDLHDEVGSLLTSITMYSDNLRFGSNTGQEKEARLMKISELSRDATVTMSDILWSVDVRNDISGSLSERMREYAEEVFIPMNIELHVDISEVAQRQQITADLRQELYLIFKESVNNIVKHSTPARVDLLFKYNNAGAFLFRIRNDGVSRERSGMQGQGLKNIRMRAGRIGAEMQTCYENRCFDLLVRKGPIT